MINEFPIDEALKHYQAFREERVNWIVESSDAAMKMVIEMRTAEALAARNTAIRSNGPLNIQGWKKLLAEDPLADLPNYIKQQQMNLATNVAGYL